MLFKVLPLTREWIEIKRLLPDSFGKKFSLLRGSGLKSAAFAASRIEYVVLPLTREWIEILLATFLGLYPLWFSLLRGSGLKFPFTSPHNISIIVLPLTREWIEMLNKSLHVCFPSGSPSYEGVD